MAGGVTLALAVDGSDPEGVGLACNQGNFGRCRVQGLGCWAEGAGHTAHGLGFGELGRGCRA